VQRLRPAADEERRDEGIDTLVRVVDADRGEEVEAERLARDCRRDDRDPTEDERAVALVR
jgi:hypothetical protein